MSVTAKKSKLVMEAYRDLVSQKVAVTLTHDRKYSNHISPYQHASAYIAEIAPLKTASGATGNFGTTAQVAPPTSVAYAGTHHTSDCDKYPVDASER